MKQASELTGERMAGTDALDSHCGQHGISRERLYQINDMIGSALADGSRLRVERGDSGAAVVVTEMDVYAVLSAGEWQAWRDVSAAIGDAA